jgi:hypothetical protein
MRLSEIRVQSGEHYDLLTDRNEIQDWLRKHGIQHFKYRTTGDGEDTIVNVDTNVNLTSFTGNRLPVRFGRILGDFTMPPKVESMFGVPTEVTGKYRISNPYFLSLEGGPLSANSYVVSNSPKLMSLEGMPERVGDLLRIGGCPKLTSLKGISEKVNTLRLIELAGLKSLDHLPKSMGIIEIRDCLNLNMSLENLFFVNNLRTIDLGVGDAKYDTNAVIAVEKIVDKYLKQPMSNARWIACQSELLDAGWDEFAGA